MRIPAQSLLTIVLVTFPACTVETTGTGDGDMTGDGDAPGDGDLAGDGDGDLASGGASLGGDGDAAAGGAGTGGDSSISGGSDGSGGDESGSGGTDGNGELPAGTFLMDDDGYIIFEAEDIAGQNPPGEWVYRSDSGPCSGSCAPSEGAYYQYDADVSDCGNHGSAPNESMTIEFEAKEAGFYRMVWRNLRDHRAGDCGDDRNNDSFVSFPGALNDDHFTEPFKVFGGGHGTFNWNSSYDIHEIGKDDVCVELKAGVETMTLAGRSNHHAIDRIAIIHTGDSLASCRDLGTNDLDGRENTGQAQ